MDKTSNGKIAVPHPGKSTQRSRHWPDDAEELFASDAERRPYHAVDVPTLPVAKIAAPVSNTVRLSSFRRTRLSPAWTFGLIGFASGIVFWHLIGFWSFVVETIYPLAALSSASAPPASVRSAATPHSLAIRATKARNSKAATVATTDDAWTATVVDAPAAD